MFVFFQFPLADSRSFLTQATGRLDNPVWPIIHPGEDFIRSFGVAMERQKGGNLNWEGEEVFSKAAQAIGFEPHLKNKILGKSAHQFSPFLHFRRFFSDGKAISRVETGFSLNPVTEDKPVSTADIKKIITDLLDLPVHIPRNRREKTYKFYNSGRQFAQHLLRSTTRIIDGKLHKTEKWWVSAAMPMIMVELYQGKPLKPLKGSRQVDFTDLEMGICLSYIPYKYKNKPVALWVLHVSNDYYGSEDYLRRLRLHIARLHAERECFKQILRNILTDKITIQRGQEASENLQEYLNKATTLLEKKYRFGIPQTEILKQAMNMQELVNEGEATSLLGRLSSIRKNYKNKVERYLKENHRQKKIFISYNHKDKPFVTGMQQKLTDAGISVQVDSQDMEFSDKVEGFIEESLQKSQYTIFVVSRNSLRSAWVAMEIVGTMGFERVLKEKKMLPVFIDGTLFDDGFYVNSLQDIDRQIKEIWENTKKVRELGGGTQFLDNKRGRLENLKHNLDAIIKKMRESLVADFSSEERINENLPKLIDLIKLEK